MNKFLHLESIHEKLDIKSPTFFKNLIRIGNAAIENSNNGLDNQNLLNRIINYIENEWINLSERFQIPSQIIAAQLKSQMVWSKLGLDIGRFARLSSSEKHLVISDKRSGNFFIESISSKRFGIAKSEGDLGYYWRGFETLSKMKGNLIPDLFEINGERSRLNNQLLYCMNHGIIKCPNNLIETTRKKEISTIHDTFFFKSIINESNQYLGTGHGHFQGFNLDIKQVISGIGYQIVVYFEKHNENPCATSIKKIIKGDWILVPPGTKDYMVSISNLRFIDFSIVLKNGYLDTINPFVENSKDTMKKIKKAADKFNVCPKIFMRAVKGPKEVEIVNQYYKVLKEMPLPTIKLEQNISILNLYQKLDKNAEKYITSLIKI